MRMKKVYFLPLLLGIVFTSCSTYQFTARQTDVRQAPIGMTEQRVGINVDYERKVTATSDYQLTRKDAIAEAEYRCLSEEKIDVVIDPIYKIEYNPFKAKTRYKATIIGYAGMYKEELNRLDDSKKYTLEEIEKYKLLYDPSFPANYYRKSADGDNYFFNSTGDYSSKPVQSSSVVIAKPVKQKARPIKLYDYRKSIQLRNWGCALMATGVVFALPIGLPCLFAPEQTYTYTSREYDVWSGTYRTRTHTGTRVNEAAQTTGIVFISAGLGLFAASIPMIAVGASRANKARKADVALNVGGNGVGLKLTF